MRVTLVNTLSHATAAADVNNTEFLREFYLPLGLLTIASVLELEGHSVQIVDPNLIARRLQTDDSRRLRAAVAKDITTTDPDIVGFTTMCDSYHHTLAIAQLVKSLRSVPIILGGPQASATAKETLANFPQVDFVVRGEADGVMHPLLAAISGSIPYGSVPGLSYRYGPDVAETAEAPLISNMDSIPIPAFHLYSHLAGKLEIPAIEAGRGCPFHCDFCSTALFFHRTYRLKSGSRILEEMELLENIFGADVSFRLVHDMLTVNKRQVERVCDTLAAAPRRRRWSCSARIDRVSNDLLHQMKRAGCSDIYFGIETGSQRMQHIIKKNLDVRKVLPTLEHAIKLGINCTMSFICGYPDEAEKDLAETLAIIMAAIGLFGPSVTVQLHVLAPYIGTELYAAQADDLEFDGYLSDQSGQPLDEADKQLIIAFPMLFSNYYAVKTKGYDRRLLFGVDAFVYILLRDFPLTLLTLRAIVGDALRVFQEWQGCALEFASPCEISIVGGSARLMQKGLRRLISLYVEKNAWYSRILDGIYLYESAVAAALRRSFGYITTDLEAPGHFSVVGQISILEAPLDVAKLRRTIAMHGDLADIQTDETHHFAILPRESGRADIHSVSPFLAKVLKLHTEHGCQERVLDALEVCYSDDEREDLAAAVNDAYLAAAHSGLLGNWG
jgi:radical SAM superfamily enzyme YgiQ (UPF0313 family)